MEYTWTVHIICPMCGHDNKLTSEALKLYNAKDGRPFVMTCDNEEGGCDRYFVAEIVLTPTVRTSTIDI
jgi:hypothetical protein